MRTLSLRGVQQRSSSRTAASVVYDVILLVESAVRPSSVWDWGWLRFYNETG